MMKYVVVATLLLLIHTITIHRSQFFTHLVSVENPHFTLSLNYGALDRFQAETARAQIFWDTQKIGTLTPEDTKVQTFTTKVKVVEGKNKLTIKGTKSSTGIIIDNVKLIREGTLGNIVENGDFQKKWPTGQKSPDTFPGWTGEPASAIGKDQNKQLSASSVAVIGSNPKQTIIQSFNFDREYRLLTSKYFMSFQYAVQAKSSLKSAYAKVSWNDQDFPIQPTDFSVHEFKRQVTVLKNALNTLKFAGEGTADGFGLTIGNIRLTALGSAVNIVINGDFQLPHIKGKTQNMKILPGWQSDNKQLTLGLATHFNQKWIKKAEQVLTLDNKQNIVISQSFNFDAEFNYVPIEKPYFTVSFKYAVPKGANVEKSKGQLLLDGEVIAEFAPENNIVHNFKEKLLLKSGENKFTIRPQAGSTVVIGDFRIIREGLNEDVTANGNFGQPAYDGFIVGWTGTGEVLNSQDANDQWKDAKVAKLDSQRKNQISQSISLDKNLKIKTNKFALEFEYVPTDEAELKVPLGQVSWNGQVFKIIANHRKINIFKIVVIASRGQNLLTFQGQGKNGQGVFIDNVKFGPYGSSNQLVTNGDFQDPEVKGAKFKSFYTITDWDGHHIEVGQGDSYSENWPEKNGQVLSLATKQKTVISKVLSLSEHLSIIDKQPKEFKLSFKYAAEQGKPLAKSGGEIFWNKVLIGDIVPTNYQINTYAITFNAKPGPNSLMIKGAGGIEAYGLTIDDVKLLREGSTDNLIENGKFINTPTPGWNSIVNHAPLLNHHWSKSHVARVDAVQGLTLKKDFQFDNNLIYKTNKFLLKFDYAIHKDAQEGKAEGSCNWNKQKFSIKPKDKKVHRFEAIVYAQNGENLLNFEGQGITIDDVRLIPWGSALSVLLNGGFQDPPVGASTNSLPSGWNSDSIQFTKGYHASAHWPYSSNQVITLTKRNKFVSQIVILSKDKQVVRPQFSFHELQLDFAAADDQDQQSCKGQVYWNSRLVGTLVPKKEGANKFIVKLDVVSGENSLTLKGLQSGIVVGNIDLVRYTLSQNIIENGKFTEKVNGNEISSWQGSAKIAKSQDYTQSWQGSKVAVLVPGEGDSISQKFKFDSILRLITSKLVLNFQYTVRQGVKFQTAKAKVIWNDKVYNLAPEDYGLHQFKEVVQARKGNNFIIFQSDGVKRHFGTFAQGFTLDDVQVRAYGSSKNLLTNGGFQQPKIEGFDYGMFTNKVPGWITKDIYLAVGYYFSKNWVDTQVVELDANRQNAKIMQKIKIGKNWEIIQ